MYLCIYVINIELCYHVCASSMPYMQSFFAVLMSEYIERKYVIYYRNFVNPLNTNEFLKCLIKK